MQPPPSPAQPPVPYVMGPPTAPPPAAPPPAQGAYAAIPPYQSPRGFPPVPPTQARGVPPYQGGGGGTLPPYQPPYQPQYQTARRGRGGRGGRGGRNSNRTARNNPPQQWAPQGYGAPPTAPNPPQQWAPQGYGAPLQQHAGQQGGGRGGRRPGDPSPYKHYNNWNMCFSCGFDVPIWHTSRTCPQHLRKHGHQETCDRTNYMNYVNAGYPVQQKEIGKYLLPINPGPHQA